MIKTTASSDGRYAATTRGITVSVKPAYLPHQSDPEEGTWVWAYNVRIENNGAIGVRLISRHWKITDAKGHRTEVRGDGVVGEQPSLEPGQVYEYTSGTPLATASGFMVGTYQMVSESGEQFDIDIPAFSLDSPDEKAPIH